MPKNPHKHKEKEFRIVIYANTGTYSSDFEIIADFTKKFKIATSEHGSTTVDNEQQVIDFIINIGKNGFLKKGTQGYVFFPPHRIHYVEAIDLEL